MTSYKQFFLPCFILGPWVSVDPEWGVWTRGERASLLGIIKHRRTRRCRWGKTPSTSRESKIVRRISYCFKQKLAVYISIFYNVLVPYRNVKEMPRYLKMWSVPLAYQIPTGMIHFLKKYEICKWNETGHQICLTPNFNFVCYE